MPLTRLKSDDGGLLLEFLLKYFYDPEIEDGWHIDFDLSVIL